MTTRPSPELRPTLWDALVIVAIIALAVAVAAVFYGGRSGGAATVVVRADGREIDRRPLSSFTESTYTARGYTLTVSKAEGGVAVTRSDCPGQDCVHTGVITRAGQSIVCLPAQLVVTLEGAAESGGPDLIAG